MRWSIRLGRVLGIDVHVHVTFFLLLAWLALGNFGRSRSLAAAATVVVFVLAIFACVVMHEFGHALTARRFGIRTRDITLLPIGGLARLERMPEDPKQELLVALAGPAVNIAIAFGLGSWLVLTGSVEPSGRIEWVGGPFLLWLLGANLFLAVFNLVPAFPMDGGRVLRALLATRIEYARATRIAATVGRSIAVGFGVIGLFGDRPMLILIALFVWIGAGQESSMAQMKASLTGVSVSRAMITRFHWLPPAYPLGDVVQLAMRAAQQDYPVMDGDRLVGFLVQADIVAALSDRGPRTPVSEVMRREVPVVEPRDMLETALRRMRECGCRALPVRHEGRLVGLITLDNIGEFLTFTAPSGPEPAGSNEG